LGINWRFLCTNKEGLSEVTGGPRKSGDSKTEHKVTITIAMLTAVFSVCNIVYAGFLTLCLVLNWSYFDNQHILQLSYVTSTIFPFVSSALNSVILICRSKNLRESLRNKLPSKWKPVAARIKQQTTQNTLADL
jgi:hypothetical protein